MKILIIEDNPNKLETTIGYINAVTNGEHEIKTATTVAKAYIYLMRNQFDRIIIDMQLPISGVNIDRFGGIQVLQHLDDSINADTKRVINSSSRETREVLDNNNYKDETLIVNSNMYDCTASFKKFMEE